MEGVEVVADELVNDALHKRFKMILTERSLLSVLMQMERLLRNIANMFGSSYLAKKRPKKKEPQCQDAVGTIFLARLPT